jgi:hypothetical protein
MKYKISSLVEFTEALKKTSPAVLEIQTSLPFPYSVILPPGFSLQGADAEKCILSFNNGLDSTGVAVSETGHSPLSHVSVVSKRGIAVRVHKQSKLTDQDRLVAKGAKGGIVKK